MARIVQRSHSQETVFPPLEPVHSAVLRRENQPLPDRPEEVPQRVVQSDAVAHDDDDAGGVPFEDVIEPISHARRALNVGLTLWRREVGIAGQQRAPGLGLFGLQHVEPHTDKAPHVALAQATIGQHCQPSAGRQRRSDSMSSVFCGKRMPGWMPSPSTMRCWYGWSKRQ